MCARLDPLGFVVAATLSTVSSGATALSNLVFDLLSFVAVFAFVSLQCAEPWMVPVVGLPAAAQQVNQWSCVLLQVEE